jgi:hypothetical protein
MGPAGSAATNSPIRPSAFVMFSRDVAYEIRMWPVAIPPNAVPARTQTPASWSSRSASYLPPRPVPEMSGKT